MIKPENRKALGPPDIKIAGLSIWVHGYQIPRNRKWSEESCLPVTVECCAKGGVVQVSGDILQVRGIIALRDSSESLHRKLEGVAVLNSLEPILFVEIRSTDRLGHLDMVVKITPEFMTQKHEFVFHIDQSYLPTLIDQCDGLLLRLRK